MNKISIHSISKFTGLNSLEFRINYREKKSYFTDSEDNSLYQLFYLANMKKIQTWHELTVAEGLTHVGNNARPFYTYPLSSRGALFTFSSWLRKVRLSEKWCLVQAIHLLSLRSKPTLQTRSPTLTTSTLSIVDHAHLTNQSLAEFMHGWVFFAKWFFFFSFKEGLLASTLSSLVLRDHSYDIYVEDSMFLN